VIPSTAAARAGEADEPALTVRQALETAIAALAAAGIASPRVDAEWLLDVYLHPVAALPGPVRARFRRSVERRARREPLQQILGWHDFRGLRLSLTPDVLVPRPETELLVDWGLERLVGARRARPRVVDVGTGSGCLACAIAVARPDARVLALDVSPPATRVARDNVRRLGLDGRVTVLVGDGLHAIRPATLDLVIANPPYLPSATWPALAPEIREHEPREAVDGGADGLDVLEPLVAHARACLRRGGALVVESAGGAQAGRVARAMTERGFTDVAVRNDLNGVDRFVAGRVN
jgi:release factor glutamine methyltransferase